MRDANSDPNATAPRTGIYDRSRRSSFGWALGILVAVLAILAFFAWEWNDEPAATGVVAPPAAVAPPASPAAPAARP